MHHDEVDVDEGLVRRLLAAQHPQWVGLPLRRVDSTGTVNAIWRLGDDLAVRLPLTPRWHDLEAERCWLRALRPRLPLPIPEPVAEGVPGEGYEWRWAVVRWVDGEPWSLGRVDRPAAAARELAGFLRALHGVDPGAVPCRPRPLHALADEDDGVRRAAHEARATVDAGALVAAWEQALSAPPWDGPPVVLHGDVMAGNVLVRDGRLHAVIDWGGVASGDPARDLMAAWTLFDRATRPAFRSAMGHDEAAWSRARGWALTRIHNVAYYAESNPRFSADAVATLREVLADPC